MLSTMPGQACQLAALAVPAPVMTRDGNWSRLEPVLLVERAIPAAGLIVMPGTGHPLNLGQTNGLNARLERLFAIVDADA